MIAFVALLAILQTADKRQSNKITAVATIFPLYDFAKNVAGQNIEINLLLPPGTEAHSYEPKPSDIAKISESSALIFANRYMDLWVNSAMASMGEGKTEFVDASQGIKIAAEKNGQTDYSYDPHVWLDLDYAQIMIDNIAASFIKIDPKNKDEYLENSLAYKAKLADLDEKFRKTLSNCRHNTIIEGGHKAFGYLAKRYNLNYLSAQGLTPEAEPTAQTLANLSIQLSQAGIKYVFYEELASSKTAQTIASQTGALLLKLNAGHEITPDDFENKTGFIGIMEKNLKNLKIGLQCE